VSTSAYSERLWVPARVHAAVIVPSFVVLAAVGWVASASIWVAVAAGTGFALWMEFVLVSSTYGRRIRRDGGWLRAGFGEKLDLRWVQSVEVVRGAETRAIRHRLVNGTPPPTGSSAVMALGGQAGMAAGQVALAWSTIRSIRSRRGMMCPAGISDAVHVVNMAGQSADEWLIASHDPERLAATIREGVAEAQAAVRAEPDPG
jgi:hypothetical protein